MSKSNAQRKTSSKVSNEPAVEMVAEAEKPIAPADSGNSPAVQALEAKTTDVAVNATELIAKFGNKSQAIRGLTAEGKTRSEVAKLLGIRYQHVNNVLKQPLKRIIKAERDAKNGEETVAA